MSQSSSWSSRIGRHITTADEVVVPARIARWIYLKSGMPEDRLIMLRGTDLLAYEVMAAIREVALTYGSDCGTKSVAEQSNTKESEVWLTTSEAAALAEVSDRAIRKRITTGNLPATRHGGQWLIKRSDLTPRTHAA